MRSYYELRLNSMFEVCQNTIDLKKNILDLLDEAHKRGMNDIRYEFRLLLDIPSNGDLQYVSDKLYDRE